ncbi:MAG: phosphate ABC transporter permease PstA [Spirochaetales bacterium]|uniref:Phosphate transport system permease protein PstA n=1 Tax=Candidatus Thalassospirochaeta sargassi TaxID=3119039 RepID=A0AAJ1MLI8_9SPIO|nr:phosphate ABC transporter permease PstA [Spirochaetales bacterium]
MSILLNTQTPVTDISIEALVNSEQRKADTHYRKSKRANTLATITLWSAAALTLAILVYILGFIIYKGFRSDNILETDYINYGTIESPLPWQSDDTIMIVNSDVRLKEINGDNLESLLKGKPSNWGNINEQDLDVIPYVLDTAEGNFGKKTIIKNDVESIAAAVENQVGAFGIIPAADADKIDGYKLNVIPVWSLGIGVSPTVLEIKDNKKMRFIDGDMLKDILRGNISNWQEIGGIDLPITLVIPPAGSYEYNAYLELAGISEDELPDTGISTGNPAEYIEQINKLDGGIGIIQITAAEANDMKTLKYQYRKTGRNIQMWFLFEEPKRAGRVGGVSSIIINTIYMVLLTVLFSTPIGIGAAVYLTEYAKQGRLVKIIRLGTETLAGIPSIIFGLFGFIVFVDYMNLGIGLLSGTLTLTLMILPTIVRTSEEAIKAVPRSFRAGSLALGAGKWQTIYKVVIPAAAPGILTGVILAVGRAVGETAALLFTMGFDYRRVENLNTSARVLSTHLYQLVKEGISFDRAFATATILIVIVLAVNVLSTKLVVRKY